MKHISFSEMKTWAECPYKHKLIYIDRIRKFMGNEFTAFGKALHNLCEHALIGNLREPDFEDFFDRNFEDEILAISDQEINLKLVEQMSVQVQKIYPLILPTLQDTFGDYEVISTEEKLYEDIIEFEDHPYKFKGFVDLIIKTKDGRYHVIDWKTCSWGWDAKKRTDKVLSYQLTLYKKFFCQKHNVDPSKVETYFALLKRTAKKENVEIFRVTSGERKTKNAGNLLTKALSNIGRGIKIKNRSSCDRCEFRKTENCK
jgi:ATP-dependent exoDNAse (exonuclease V) beta subunit